MRRVVIDTGPLVALLNRRDPHHDWARSLFDGLEPPLYSCEPVLTEAHYLLRSHDVGQNSLLRLLAAGVIHCEFRMQLEVDALTGLMRRFASVPMSLADACLVRMSELERDTKIATLDSDFKIYRRNERHVIPTLMPKSQ